jgi:heme/copper-type cytochrome/quinol oxidase subunit 4
MSVRTYALVFSLLVIITAVELVITNLQLFTRTALVTTLIGLAGVKAVFVAMFFQHLKDEPRSLSSLLLGGLVIATMLLVISFLQLHPAHF